jgi:hypothetical protein
VTRTPRKYRNKPVTVDGIRFDSQREYERWCELRLLERAGAIAGLERQVTLPLDGMRGPIRYESGRQARIVVDFAYFEGDQCQRTYEDTKGLQTPMSKLQHAVARAMGIPIRISR